jgi:hypothetical protein
MQKIDTFFYYSYIIIGVLYIIVKLIFISFGYLEPNAMMHGLIVAIPTTLIGILSLIELKKWKGKTFHLIAILLPILAIVITPIYMYVKMGSVEWLTEGRLPVLIIYEIFAAIQIIISIYLYRKK